MASTVCPALCRVVSSHSPIRSVCCLSTACSPSADHRPGLYTMRPQRAQHRPRGAAPFILIVGPALPPWRLSGSCPGRSGQARLGLCDEALCRPGPAQAFIGPAGKTCQQPVPGIDGLAGAGEAGGPRHLAPAAPGRRLRPPISWRTGRSAPAPAPAARWPPGPGRGTPAPVLRKCPAASGARLPSGTGACGHPAAA